MSEERYGAPGSGIALGLLLSVTLFWAPLGLLVWWLA